MLLYAFHNPVDMSKKLILSFPHPYFCNYIKNRCGSGAEWMFQRETEDYLSVCLCSTWALDLHQ